MPSSTQKHCFYIMHIYGEEARGKIPIKSLSWEFRKAGLRPSASSVYIFYLRNVTSEKEHHFFFQKHIKVGLHSQGKRFPLISCDMILQTQLSSSYRLARGFPKWGGMNKGHLSENQGMGCSMLPFLPKRGRKIYVYFVLDGFCENSDKGCFFLQNVKLNTKYVTGTCHLYKHHTAPAEHTYTTYKHIHCQRIHFLCITLLTNSLDQY